MLKKYMHLLIIFLFIIPISLPIVIWLGVPDKEQSLSEKREFAIQPKLPLDMKSAEAFPDLFSAYYADHFGFREPLSKAYKTLKFKLGDSSSDDVTIGKDGWLFFGSIKKVRRGYNNPFDNARNSSLYSQADLEKTAQHFIQLQRWLADKGIKYIFIIAPNKHTIYFDMLPGYVKKVHPISAADQLIDYLRTNTDVSVLDLREPLLAAKQHADVYYKTGTHWNYLGANVAQKEIMALLSQWYPGEIDTSSHPDSAFREVKSGDVGLESMLGIELSPPLLNLAPVFNGDCAGKRIDDGSKGNKEQTFICEGQTINALVFRDSFFNKLQAYTKRKFNRSTYLWEKLTMPALKKQLDNSLPHVVIEEWVERTLPYNPGDSWFYKSFLDTSFQAAPNTVYSSIDSGTNGISFAGNLEKLGKTENSIELRVLGNNAILDLPHLTMNASKYKYQLKMWSSVNSTARLYYSIKGQKGYPYTAENSSRMKVSSGENIIYGFIDKSNLGGKIRLIPISSAGLVTIESFIIKEY